MSMNKQNFKIKLINYILFYNNIIINIIIKLNFKEIKI